MAFGTITSTENTFGSVNGAVSGTVQGTLTGSVGVPGPEGPVGPAGPQGPAGPPGTGGTWGSIVGTLSNQTDLQNALDAKQNVSGMSAYLTKAGNLSGLTDLATARDNLQLGVLYSPTFAGLTVQGSGANVANLTPTSLSLNHATSGSFVIQPSSGITFPDTTIQTTAFNATAMLPYALIDSQVFTGTPSLPAGTIGVTAALGDNDTSLATTAFVQQELLSGTANARNLEVLVRNQTGSTIPAGSIVYVSGATGNLPLVTLAQGNNDANSAQTMGFVKTAIANNGTGYVIIRGIIENLDTSALTEGVQLYLSPTTPGAWTTTKPVAPNHMVYVGIVIRSHPTQGTILVAVQNGLELEELHDVLITSPTNGQVLKYDSVSGLWKNGTDVGGVAWGGITGTLSSQTDLQTALDGKYSTTNPAGYITSAALSPYLTSATAASTYQTLSGMSSYLTTSSAASTYYPLTNPYNFITSAGLAGYATESWVTSQGYITSSALTPYATLESPALTGNVTITTNSTSPALVITQDGTGDVIQFKDATSDTTYSFIDQNGKVGTVASTTTSAGFNVPHGTAPTSPVNGDIWTTTGNLWVRINGASQAVALQGNSAQLSSNNIFTNASSTYGNSTAAGTINLGTGATISGATKVVNIGTGGVAGSTTAIVIGSTTGTSTTTLQGITNGVTQSAGDSSLKLATTAFVTTADNLKADLASPALTGTPTAPTASPGTNTTQLATTAFVTAAVPAIATVAQVYASTSGTTATPPLLAPLAFNSGGYFPRMNFASSSSGTGAGVGGADNRFEIIGPNVATAGFAQITSEHQQMWSAGTTFTILQFSKPVWFSFRMCNFSATYDGDAQTEIKAFIGNAVTGGVDPSAPAVGIYKAGGAGSFINLMVHNGTTLTKVATTTTFNTTVIDVAIYSNNGTVNLYLNGVLAATTALGPTGTSNTTRVIAAVKATATAAVRQLLEIANIKVFAPQ